MGDYVEGFLGKDQAKKLTVANYRASKIPREHVKVKAVRGVKKRG